MTRRGLAALAIAATALGLLGCFAGLAAASAPHAVAWWWVAEQGAKVPPPTFVPDGGLYVAADLTGPEAIAALRFADDPDARPASLKLQSSMTTGTPAVVACAATTPWQPVAAGDWKARPAYDCKAFRAAAVIADDGAVALSLAGLAPGAGVDLVLLPDPEATGAFQLALDPPKQDALTVVTQPRADSAAARLDERSAPAPAPVFGPLATAARFSGSDGDSAPLLDAGPDAAATGYAPRAQGGGIVGAEQVRVGPTTGRNGRSWGRIVAAMVVVALMIAIARLQFPQFTRGRRAPDGSIIEGLGRFARPRHGDPPPL